MKNRRTGRSRDQVARLDVRRMIKQVRQIASDSGEVYIGRTCDPDARREEHAELGRHHFTVLGSSLDIREVCSAESALISGLSHLYKLANRTSKSLGPRRSDLANYVYVASRRKGMHR